MNNDSNNNISPPIELAVASLPVRDLAFSNKVYVSPVTLKILGIQEDTTHPLVRIGQNPYMLEAHPQVEEGQIALNGLHRRYMWLAIGQTVSVQYFCPSPGFALASIEFSVDMLAKKAATSRRRPQELDTDRLACEVLKAYEEQVFEKGRVLAMDFEGTKLELTVKDAAVMELDDSCEKKYGNMGRLLQLTELSFSRADGATCIQLAGSHMARGAGGASNIFLSDFDFGKLGIGGLDAEFNTILRRAFLSRMLPPHQLKEMGLKPVRGMLLYGPPGCGKTLIARQIGKVLNAREPKIVNGPEILDKFVGGSEKNVRALFAEAEQEQMEKGEDSSLHIIILDEMDAICKQRGTVRDETGVSDSVVNQLLSKIDGVNALNNILLIGMTNRKDMIDEALLRPGRLGVHVEIGLPDLKGREQILNIHTAQMREHNRLAPELIQRLPDIAIATKNFSGAEIEDLVEAAASHALTRCIDVKDLSKPCDTSNLLVEYADFQRALAEVEPKFGAKSQELKAYYRDGFVPYGDSFDYLMGRMEHLVEQVRASPVTSLTSVLLQGQIRSGKTAVAAKAAVDSGFPFVRMISAKDMIGCYSDTSKCQTIEKVFTDSYKSPLSLIFIDNVERIFEYVPVGPRFSNTVLQTLLALLETDPPDGCRLLVIGTTSCPRGMEDLGLIQTFGFTENIPSLEKSTQIAEVLRVATHMNEEDAEYIAHNIKEPIGIKQLLMVAKTAQQGDVVDVKVFKECLRRAVNGRMKKFDE